MEIVGKHLAKRTGMQPTIFYAREDESRGIPEFFAKGYSVNACLC